MLNRNLVERDGSLDRGEGTLGERGRAFRAVRQQQRELVSAAELRGARAADPLEPPGDRPQHRIPVGVTERSVDRAEALEVDQEHDRSLLAAGAAHGARDLLSERCGSAAPWSWSRRASR